MLYTPNGGRSWYPLEVDTPDPQLAIQTSEIASGDQVQFRVLASDGLYTTRADSPPIQVRNGMRRTAQTNEPAVVRRGQHDSQIRFGRTVRFARRDGILTSRANRRILVTSQQVVPKSRCMVLSSGRDQMDGCQGTVSSHRLIFVAGEDRLLLAARPEKVATKGGAEGCAAR